MSQFPPIGTDRFQIAVGAGIAAFLARLHHNLHQVTDDQDIERGVLGGGLGIGDGLRVGIA